MRPLRVMALAVASYGVGAFGLHPLLSVRDGAASPPEAADEFAATIVAVHGPRTFGIENQARSADLPVLQFPSAVLELASGEILIANRGAVMRLSGPRVSRRAGSVSGRSLDEMHAAVGDVFDANEPRLEVISMTSSQAGDILMTTADGYIIRLRDELIDVLVEDVVATDIGPGPDDEILYAVPSDRAIRVLSTDETIPMIGDVISPRSFVTAPNGDMYIADTLRQRVWRRSPDGEVRAMAERFSSESQLYGMALAPDGSVYVADRGAQRVLRVTDDEATSVAGSGSTGPSIDGRPASSTALHTPVDVAVLSGGTIAVVEDDAHLVRAIHDGVVTTLVGPTSRVNRPLGVVLLDGHVVVTDERAGRVVDVREQDFSVVTARLDHPVDLLEGSKGRWFVTDFGTDRVVSVGGGSPPVVVVGGGGRTLRANDPPVAGRDVALRNPHSLAERRDGSVVVTAGDAIFQIDGRSRVTLLAGGRGEGYSPDGTSARDAKLRDVRGVAVDAEDRVVFAESGNHRVRRIEANGALTTLVGSGSSDTTTAGRPATRTSIDNPQGVVVLDDGTLCFTEWLVGVLCVDDDGIVQSVVGSTAKDASAEVGASARTARLGVAGDLSATGNRLAVVDAELRRVIVVEFDNR